MKTKDMMKYFGIGVCQGVKALTPIIVVTGAFVLGVALGESSASIDTDSQGNK